MGNRYYKEFHFIISFKDPGNCFLTSCECEIGEADRGWFERLHNYCKDKQSDNESKDDCRPGSDAYQFIMSIAIVCGFAWILAGSFSFLAHSARSNTDKVFALGSLAIYIVGYIIFAGLFGIVMNQINYRNFNASYCLMEKFRRSGDEFMAYSICGFILIMISIMCMLCSLDSM